MFAQNVPPNCPHFTRIFGFIPQIRVADAGSSGDLDSGAALPQSTAGTIIAIATLKSSCGALDMRYISFRIC